MFYLFIGIVSILVSNISRVNTDSCVSHHGRRKKTNKYCLEGQKMLEQTSYQPFTKNIILIAYVFVIGLDIGCKLKKKTLIYIFNLCHIMSYIQICLVATIPFKRFYKIRRVILITTMYMVAGPSLAFIFWEFGTSNLRYHAEYIGYFIQHTFLLLIPFYLSHQFKQNEVEEDRLSISCTLFAYGTLVFYLSLTTILSHISMANLNTGLCPVKGMPFPDNNYRIHLLWMSFILIAISGQIYICLVK